MTRTVPLLLILVLLTGCTIGGTTRLESIDGSGKVEPTLRTVVYAPEGDSGAQVFLTDLPRDLLVRGADLSNASGHLVHINMFLMPRPGRTPIDAQASNASVRWILIAQGEIGIYSGGGFVLPASRPGKSTFRGNVRGATLKLESQTPYFNDALGSTRLFASFRAPKDEAYTRLVAARFEEIVASLNSEP